MRENIKIKYNLRFQINQYLAYMNKKNIWEYELKTPRYLKVMLNLTLKDFNSSFNDNILKQLILAKCSLLTPKPKVMKTN